MRALFAVLAVSIAMFVAASPAGATSAGPPSGPVCVPKTPWCVFGLDETIKQAAETVRELLDICTDVCRAETTRQ